MREHGGFLEQDRIQQLFTQLDRIRSRWDQTDNQYRDEPHVVTQRRVDEAQTAGQRVYTAAGSLIAAALDNLDALRVLLHPGGGGVGPWAPYNLIRGAFLPAIWAIWILEPLDSKQRRIRGLHFAIVDQKEWDNFWTTFPQDADAKAAETSTRLAEQSAKVAKIYHDEADQLGLSWATARMPINLIQELPKLETLRRISGDRIGTIIGLWRGMSGIAHGYGYAVQAFSDMRVGQKTATGTSVTTFLNDQRLSGNALLTGSAVISAMELHRVRSLEPIRPR